MKTSYITHVIQSYLLDGNFNAAFGTEWIDEDQLKALTEQIAPAAFRSFAIIVYEIYDEFSIALIQGLIANGAIIEAGDEYSGRWFKLRPSRKNDFIKQIFDENPATKLVNTLGDEALRRALVRIAQEDGLLLSDLEVPMTEVIGSMNAAEGELVPASDRMVPLNHNNPAHREIAQGLDELYEEFRQSNEAGESDDERARILKSIEAARSFWSAPQLTVLQIKVGLILAIADAGNALAKVGKATGWALLIDQIKNLVLRATT